MKKLIIFTLLITNLFSLFVITPKSYANLDDDCVKNNGVCRETCGGTGTVTGLPQCDPKNGITMYCCISALGCGGGMGPFAGMLCALLGKNDTVDNTKVAVGNQLNSLISGFIGIMTLISSLWFIIQIVIAGFEWITAAGDKNMLQTARYKILNAIIGLVIVAGAWVLIGLISMIVGVPILNPGEMLKYLGI